MDLKYRLDILDDVRGGQHNFIPNLMGKREISRVLTFGEVNAKQLQAVARVAKSCENIRYAAFPSSIANGSFGNPISRDEKK